MQSQQLDQITKLLQQYKSKDGVSMQDHLQAVLEKYVTQANFDGDFSNFEVLSNFVKRNQFVYKDPKTDKEVNNIPIQHGELYEWCQQINTLLKDYEKLKKQKDLNILFPNFQNDANMIEQTGVYFGEEETHRISMSLRKLQNQTQATQLRFWGKILASQNDYYIAEGIISNKYADQVPAGSESKGDGANTYTYWVTHNVLGEWFELPFVTPEQIIVARQIKYIFTGDLNKEIKTYPAFPGKEKHLLRAQIARIGAASVLVPKDLYNLNEETKQLEYGEEPFKLQEYGELKTLDNWVHLYPGLLNMGRCSYWVDPSLPEEKREEKLGELAEKDPEIERLKGITEEKSPYWKEGDEEEQPNWLIKEYGDLQQYNLVGKDDGNTGCYGIISIKNLTWPGASLVCNSKGWANIYVGYGLKVNQNPFNPVQPANIQDEGDDIEEFPEPNPDKPIMEIEPDSDKEGKEGEDGEEEDA